MKKLHLLVLRSFIGPFILIFFIVLFILLMQFLWRYIDDLIGKGLGIGVIAELLLYTSSSLVPMALPLSILMSSLMTFGNMGEFYELTAIKASGISLQRIMMPLIVLVIFISIGAFFFANEVLPYTNLKMRSLLYDVRNQRPEISIMPGTFYNGIDGYSMRIDRKNPVTNMMYNIKIYDHSLNRGNVSISIADSGKMIVTDDERTLIFTLYHGFTYNEMEDEKDYRRKKSFPHRFDRFDEQKIIIELTGFSLTRTDENLFRNHYSMLDIGQLGRMKDSIKNDVKEKENALYNTLITNNFFRKKDQYLYDDMQFIPGAASEKTRTRKRLQHGLQEALHDSINEVINARHTERINENEKDSERGNITYNYKTSSVDHEPEQVKPRAVPTKKNTDPEVYKNLYERLTLKEKENVLSTALTYARSSRSYVESSSNAIDAKLENFSRYDIEWHRKFTISFACLVFLFIGAPLGAIIRKGGLGLPLVISTLLFIFYYIISIFGEKIVRESFLAGYQGMWMAPMIFFITGIFLTYKATTDAAILNFETYSLFLQKYLGIKRMMVTQTVESKTDKEVQKEIKYDNLLASLTSFRDSTENALEEVSSHLNFTGFFASLIGIRQSSDLILYERLYKNIISRIMESRIYEDHSVKNKLSEFPDFSYGQYYDVKGRLYLKIILLFVPPVTIVILIRHYVRLSSLKTKLRDITQLTVDLVLLLKKNQIFNN